MNCKNCGRFSYFGDYDTCQKCERQEAKKQGLTNHYRRLGKFDMTWAVLNCRKKGFSLDEIAEILDRDIADVKFTWDIIRQDSR